MPIQMTPGGLFQYISDLPGELLTGLQRFQRDVEAQIGAGGGIAKGTATLVGGVVTVASALVTSTSRFQLTGQDDEVNGALRGTNRVVGVSFDIVSNDGADSGLVHWIMYT